MLYVGGHRCLGAEMVNHPQKRAEFCRLYLAERAVPATIVTKNGDIPLAGEGPQ
ncbi:MAG: hypothetical protein JNM66_08140 [Bryobacterales bacterium]|nr:hypothetical protein [Bryobacterales bacterium]